MDFMKKYYNAIVGVAIVGVFVLGLTISGSAGNILASVSNLVGGQRAQVSSLVSCALTKDLKQFDQDPQIFILQKYFNRIGYTINGDGFSVRGNESDFFDAGTENSLYFFQKDLGIEINSPAPGVIEPIIDSATRTAINSGLRPIDCLSNDVQNRPYIFKNFSGIPGLTESPQVLPSKNTGERMSIMVDVVEKVNNGPANATKGYKATAHIYKKVEGIRTGSFTQANAVSVKTGTNNGSSVWNINIDAPTVVGEYVLRVAFRCAVSGSSCDTDYGKDGHTMTIDVPFVVSDLNDDPTNPNPPGSIDYFIVDSPIIGSTYNDPSLNPIRVKWNVLDVTELKGGTKLYLVYAGKYGTENSSHNIGDKIEIRNFASPVNGNDYQMYLPKYYFDGKWYLEIEGVTVTGATVLDRESATFTIKSN